MAVIRRATVNNTKPFTKLRDLIIGNSQNEVLLSFRHLSDKEGESVSAMDCNCHAS